MGQPANAPAVLRTGSMLHEHKAMSPAIAVTVSANESAGTHPQCRIHRNPWYSLLASS